MAILHISLATLFIIQIVALCFVEYRKLIAEFLAIFFEGRTSEKWSQKIKIYLIFLLTIPISVPIFFIIAPILLVRLPYLRKKDRINEEKFSYQDRAERKEYERRRRNYSQQNPHLLYFPKSKLLSPSQEQIIFIPGARDTEFNRYIEEHLLEVKERFRLQCYDFFYLPEFVASLNEYIKYQNPELNSDEVSDLVKEINKTELDFLSYVENKDALKPNASAFIRYIGFCDASLDTETSYAFSYYLAEPFTKPDDISYDEIIDIYISELYSGETLYCLGKPDKDDTADFHFSMYSNNLMKEIRDRLVLLRKNGVSEALLRELFEPTDTISRLFITSDFRIFLPDYNNIEIKLEPLNKAVFFLFLKHEEGIIFKHLIDYTEELIEIYEEIIECGCDMKRRKSIERICDPTNNSINEKCARIREAFVYQFDERLAKNYFITGKRGEAKKITLSRDLIFFK